MIIIPAIDIKDGKCVRLFQGDFNQQTTYSNDPLEVALKWQSMGAQLIHIVDLDGALTGEPVNTSIIYTIVQKIRVEVGGGIRDIKSISKYLDMGVERVVLGTSLLEDFGFAKEVFEKFGDQIVIGLDAKNGELMTKGWVSSSKKPVLETAKKLQGLGAKRIIFTDILKDGSLTGPSYQALEELAKGLTIPIIASGGISNIEQIKKLKQIGVEGAILGKALYEGKMSLQEALSEFSETNLKEALDVS